MHTWFQLGHYRGGCDVWTGDRALVNMIINLQISQYLEIPSPVEEGTLLHRCGKFTLHSAHCSATVMEPMEVIKQEYISLSFYDDTIVQHLSLTIHFKRNSTDEKELYLFHEISHINHKFFRSWSSFCHQEKYETYFWVYPWAGIRQSEWTQQSRFHIYT